MKVELISETTYLGNRFAKKDLSGEELIIAICRESTNRSLDTRHDDYQKLLGYLIRNSHWSPFEMIDLTFYIETSISISKQLIRHRSFNFQELSRRYTSNDIEFEEVELRVANEDVKKNDLLSNRIKDKKRTHLEKIVSDHLMLSMELYQALIREHISPECARFILPQATQTRLYMKGSLRCWLTFLLQRLTNHAQVEMKAIATEINNVLIQLYPNIMKAFFEQNNIK